MQVVFFSEEIQDFVVHGGGVGGQQSVVYVDQQDRNALIISPEIQTWIKDRLSETDFLD